LAFGAARLARDAASLALVGDAAQIAGAAVVAGPPPPQQALPTVPQASHIPCTQPNPALQVPPPGPPPQQASPPPPHASQVPCTQRAPVAQALLAQQSCVAAPHSV
jgi:hypothetical protein